MNLLEDLYLTYEITRNENILTDNILSKEAMDNLNKTFKEVQEYIKETYMSKETLNYQTKRFKIAKYDSSLYNLVIDFNNQDVYIYHRNILKYDPLIGDIFKIYKGSTYKSYFFKYSDTTESKYLLFKYLGCIKLIENWGKIKLILDTELKKNTKRKSINDEVLEICNSFHI